MKYLIFSKKGKLLYELEKMENDYAVFVYQNIDMPKTMMPKEVANFLAKKDRQGLIINDENGYIEMNGLYGQIKLMRDNN